MDLLKLVTELRTAAESAMEAPASNFYNTNVNMPEGHPESKNTSEWDPLWLLQNLQEVNSCMMAVANTDGTNNNIGKRPLPKTPASTSPGLQSRFHHIHHQHSHHQRSCSGGGHMRSPVPHAERRLPPLPTPP